MDLHPLIMLLLLCALPGLAFLPRRSDLTIQVRGSEVTVKGKLAKGKQARITSFFQDLAAGKKLQVRYNYPRAGKQRPVQIRGDVTEGERQQIRNFLKTEL